MQKLENFFGERMPKTLSRQSSMNSMQASRSDDIHTLNGGDDAGVPAVQRLVQDRKLKNFFGDRPPSQLISGNLTKFFPGAQIPAQSSPLSLKPDAGMKMSPSFERGMGEPSSPSVASLDINDTASSLSASLPRTRPQRIKWVKGRLLGTGSFGNVYLGMNSQTGTHYVDKA
jgi:hypothetical protein